MRLGRPLLVASALALGALACSDTGLIGIRSDDRLSITAELCNGPPVDTQQGVNVLFLTDSSNSMRFNDPNDLLVDAMEHVTTRYQGTSNIAFAIIRWGSGKTVRENLDYEPTGTDPPLFTNDPARLSAIFTRLRQPATVNPDKYLDGTDYELALRAATDYLVADLAKNPGQSLTTRYLVQFVTDGIPQSATNNPLETRKAIVASTANLHERYGARVDVTSIALSMVLPPEFVGLLPEMARVGGGAYTQLTTPQGLDGAFDKALANRSQLVEYELEGYFVLNRHLRMAGGAAGPAAQLDSDGDGLLDGLEARIGTDPTNPDSDRDGLSDLFESLLGGEYDPRSLDRSPRGEGGDLDPDHDGLSTYEELRLGTDPQNPDTDRDGLPDGMELLFAEYAYHPATRRLTGAHLDPLAADAQADPDGDGLPAAVEVRQNLSPFAAEPAELRGRAGYRVAPVTEPIRSSDGIRCWSLRVDNIALGPTLAGVDAQGRARPAGLNTLEVIGIERPVIGAGTSLAARLLPYRQLKARRQVILGEHGERDPQALTLHLWPQEFTP